MPAYRITLTLLFLKFFLQSKDNLFLSTIIQFSRIRVYAQVSVWVCAWDCPGMQMYMVQPWLQRVVIDRFCYLRIYPEYIFPVLHILNSLVLTVKTANNSHGDYKNTASRVGCKSHENTLLIMLMWEEQTEAGCVGNPPACARTYTHPNTDLNAHIWKYQYIFFRHPTLYRKTKKDTHYNNYPTLYSVRKEPKSAIQKLSLTFFLIYTLCFLTMTMMASLFFFFIP